jgi:hypothetical protein
MLFHVKQPFDNEQDNLLKTLDGFPGIIDNMKHGGQAIGQPP